MNGTWQNQNLYRTQYWTVMCAATVWWINGDRNMPHKHCTDWKVCLSNEPLLLLKTLESNIGHHFQMCLTVKIQNCISLGISLVGRLWSFMSLWKVLSVLLSLLKMVLSWTVKPWWSLNRDSQCQKPASALSCHCFVIVITIPVCVLANRIYPLYLSYFLPSWQALVKYTEGHKWRWSVSSLFCFVPFIPT